MFAKVNVDIVNSMASDYGDILFNIRNLKTNQYLSQRDSWNLGKSAAAIRTIVNCLKGSESDCCNNSNATATATTTTTTTFSKRRVQIFSTIPLFCIKTHGVGYCICCYKFSRN